MIQIKNLCKNYYKKTQRGRKKKFAAVKDFSLNFAVNNSYSLVGESGSGKSTLARLILGLEKPDKGQILYKNNNIALLNRKELRELRSDFHLVLQNSSSALDPKMKIYNSIAEAIRNFSKLSSKVERERIMNLLEEVGLNHRVVEKLPHQLSGGQQKRVCIARAIAANPKFIIFDEAVSGLDVTVRKKVLDLILKLRNNIKSAFLFITHDIDVALYMSENIIVMKDGEVVEYVEKVDSFYDFKHPYSKILINSLPPRYPEEKNSYQVI